MVYMGPADGNSWTKLFHEGYEDGWATHKLKETKGQHSVIVPDVPAGNYLFRGGTSARLPPYILISDIFPHS